MNARPAWWRLPIAIAVAPVAPLLLFSWLIEPPTLRLFRDYVLMIGLGVYPATLIVGIPLWFAARRWRWRWGITALITGLLVLLPWAMLVLASGWMPRSGDGSRGIRDLLAVYWSTGELPLVLAQCGALGILGGAIFHVIAFGWHRAEERWFR
jgi:hypothetical protein